MKHGNTCPKEYHTIPLMIPLTFTIVMNQFKRVTFVILLLISFGNNMNTRHFYNRLNYKVPQGRFNYGNKTHCQPL